MGSEWMNEEENNFCGIKSVSVSMIEAKNVLGPATPEENGEQLHGHEYNYSSPTPKSKSSYAELETPKETLFDSFAPASDKFLLAPHHRKYREESRNPVVRRLDFASTTPLPLVVEDEDAEEEKRLFEIVYSTIMDAIFAEAATAIAVEPTTPRSAPLLTGVAETCPAAPIKPARKQRRIPKEICKKLDF